MANPTELSRELEQGSHNAQTAEPLSLLSIMREQTTGQSGPRPEAGRTVGESVNVNGANRDFALHVPAGWDGKSPLPVLYYFNGMRPDGKAEPESFTGLSERSDRDGFAVVYMRGSNPGNQTYNNGQRMFANSADESSYLNAVRTSVAGQLPVDATRQGLAGFSQGGSEAYAMAAANSWVSSVQSVEGYMTGLEAPLTRPISEQNIHALRDPIIPHNGTNQVCEQADREMQAVLDSMQYTGEAYLDPKQILHSATCYIERNGNNIEPQSRIVNDYRVAAGASSEPQVATTPDHTVRTYTNPATGAEVRQVVLNSGTHGWAGSTDHSGDMRIIGIPNANYSASDSIAEFFLHHPLAQRAQ